MAETKKKPDPSEYTEQIKTKKPINKNVITVTTVFLFAIGLYLIVCLFLPNLRITGVVGDFIRNTLLGGFGGAAYLFPFVFLIHGLLNKRDFKTGRVVIRWFFSLMVIFFTGVLIHACTYTNITPDTAFTWKELVTNGRALKGGGGLSGGFAQAFTNWIGPVGIIIFTILLLLLFLFLFLAVTPASVAQRIRFYVKRRAAQRTQSKNESKARRAEKEKIRYEYQLEKEKQKLANLAYNNSHMTHPSKEPQFIDMELDDEVEIKTDRRIKSTSGLYSNLPNDDDTDSNIQRPNVSNTGKTTRIVSSVVIPETQKQVKHEEPVREERKINLRDIFDEPENQELSEKYENEYKEEAEKLDYEDRAAELTIKIKPEEEVRYERPREPEQAPQVIVIPPSKPEVKQEVKPEPRQEIKSEPKPEPKPKKQVPEEKPYVFPPVDLLDNAPRRSDGTEEEESQENADRLVEALSDLGIPTRVVGISRGPKVTRYDVQLEKGVRVNQIKNRVDDISYALATTGVRITGIIAGKSAIGIEVPNRTPTVVSMREMIDCDDYRRNRSLTAVSLGINIPGKKLYMDICRMPHLLVAGTTGSGKSVLLHSFIISMLYKATPEQVKFILVDPKKVEFAPYKELPHMIVPTISEPAKAAGALFWATQEMDRRFQLFEENRVVDIDTYRDAVSGDCTKEKLPYIIVIIDEFSDLMMQAPDDVEKCVIRLAQKARAAGIHLIIGTQRPTVDVVTGLIKANVPSRISLMVSNLQESRIIIDEPGAQNLLGKGDMLYRPVGASSPERIQGAWISIKEINRVVQFITENNKNDDAKYNVDVAEEIDRAAKYVDKKTNKSNQVSFGDADEGDQDPLLQQAIETTINGGDTVSITTLQRRMGLGFPRAAKLVDIMEARGIIGPAEGQKPRKVLMTKEEYAEMLMNQDTDE